MSRGSIGICLAVIAMLLGIGGCRPANIVAPRAKKGVLDLRNWDFSIHGTVTLSGEWEFFWKKFLFGKSTAQRSGYTKVPSYWAATTLGKKLKAGAKGYATYRLTILLPENARTLREGLMLQHRSVHTSSRLFVMDGSGSILFRALGNGRVGKSEKEYRPGVLSESIKFRVFGQKKLVLLMQVSNFLHRKGGLTRPPRLGDAKLIEPLQDALGKFNFFLVGLFWFMSFYFLMMFFFHRTDRGALWLGIFCLLFGIRTGLTEEYFYTFATSTFLWHQMLRLEYISMYLSFPTVLVFTISVVRQAHADKAVQGISLVSIVMSLLTIVLQPLYYTHLLKLFFPLFVIAGFYVLFKLVQLLWRDGLETIVLINLLGFLFVIVTGAFDSLYIFNLSTDVPFLKFGIFGFLVTQSLVLAIANRRSRLSIENLADELETRNADLALKNQRLEEMARATERFVPSQFLALLGKKDITDVQLGDHTEEQISILFSDIRAFTTLSETMTPRQNFEFINDYLQWIEPVVTQHHGFIDKYIGDGVMAIFQRRPDDAVECGIAMIRAVEEFNKRRRASGLPGIDIGVGVNTGTVMLGTIGGAERMDGTVISDSVNLAARLEGLTKAYGVRILLSENTRNGLEHPNSYDLREIDLIRPKGKSEAVTIFEAYDVDEDSKRLYKEEKQALFDESLELYRQQKFPEAITGFRRYLEGMEDPVARLYIERCEYGMQRGVQSQWDATFNWHSK